MLIMVITTPNSKSPSGEPPWQPNLWNNPRNMKIKATHNCYSYMLNDLHTIPRVHGKPQPGAYAKLQLLINSSNRLNCNQVRKGVCADNPYVRVLSCKKGLHYRCKPGYYKGFMMVAPGVDFHFARQDNRMISVYRKMHRDIVLYKLKLPTDKRKLVNLYLNYINSTIPNILKLARDIYPNIKSRKQLLKAVFKTSHTWSHKPGASNATDKDASGNYILNPLTANWNYSNQGGINYNKHCCFFEIPSNYTHDTFSTGYTFISSKLRNNPIHRRKDLSKMNNIDQQYESKLLMVIKSKLVR
jgi:hypothetical protein